MKVEIDTMTIRIYEEKEEGKKILKLSLILKIDGIKLRNYIFINYDLDKKDVTYDFFSSFEDEMKYHGYSFSRVTEGEQFANDVMLKLKARYGEFEEICLKFNEKKVKILNLDFNVFDSTLEKTPLSLLSKIILNKEEFLEITCSFYKKGSVFNYDISESGLYIRLINEKEGTKYIILRSLDDVFDNNLKNKVINFYKNHKETRIKFLFNSLGSNFPYV